MAKDLHTSLWPPFKRSGTTITQRTASDDVSLNAGQLSWSAGKAVTAGNYSIGRDTDATNQLHLNVPSSSRIAMSVNDVDFLRFNVNGSGNPVIDTTGAAAGDLYVKLGNGNELIMGDVGASSASSSVWTTSPNSGFASWYWRTGAGLNITNQFRVDYANQYMCWGVGNPAGRRILYVENNNASLNSQYGGTAQYHQMLSTFASYTTCQFSAEPTTDICTVTSTNLPAFKTCTAMTLTTTGTLPAPLLVATTYYAIRISGNTFKLATSLANANAGTAIDITDAGSGSHTSTPTLDFGEVVNFSYTGFRCGTPDNIDYASSTFGMQTDRPSDDFTISAVNAKVQAASLVNPNGAHLVLMGGNANTSDLSAGNGGSIKIMPGKRGQQGDGALSFYDNKVDLTNYAEIKYNNSTGDMFFDKMTGTNGFAFGYASSGIYYPTVRINATSSSLNYWQFTGAIDVVGATVKLETIGSTTNVNGAFVTRGTGTFSFYSGGNTNDIGFQISASPSAVNYWKASGMVTGSPAVLAATGSDTNVNGGFATKGTGLFSFRNNNGGNIIFQIDGVASSVNYFQSTSSATGNGVTLAATGSDTNVNALFTAKGTGNFQFTPTTGLNNIFNYNNGSGTYIGHAVAISGGITLASNASFLYKGLAVEAHTLTMTGGAGGVGVVAFNGAQITISNSTTNQISIAAGALFDAPTVTSGNTIVDTTFDVLTGSSDVGIRNTAQTIFASIGGLTRTVNMNTTTQVTSDCAVSFIKAPIITVGQTGGAVTVDSVATIYAAGAPVAGASVTLTNAYGLWIDAGLSRLDGGVSFAASGQSTLNNYTEGTFSPTVTLVGGAGNTVPVYSTNTGRYTRIGRQVFVDVYLTGDGGDEGAGTGTFTVALPVASSASHPTSYFPVGFFQNGTAEDPIWGKIAASTSVIDFAYEDVLNNFTVMTGAEQNNTTRTVRLKFNYEI